MHHKTYPLVVSGETDWFASLQSLFEPGNVRGLQGGVCPGGLTQAKNLCVGGGVSTGGLNEGGRLPGGRLSGQVSSRGAFVPEVYPARALSGHPDICRRAKFQRNPIIRGRIIAI